MISTTPVESFGELPERFPGIEELDPTALGRFAFHAAVHTPTDDFRYLETGEQYEDWHLKVKEALTKVAKWQDLDSQRISRAEMAGKIAAQRQQEIEKHSLISALIDTPPDEGYELVRGYLRKAGFGLQAEIAPSPLFPEGRTARTSLDDAESPDTGKIDVPRGWSIVDKEGRQLSAEIRQFLDEGYPRRKAHEQIKAALADTAEVDTARFEGLRARYGAKAAGLICFDEEATRLNQALEGNLYSVHMVVPPFIPVSTGVYEAWLSEPDSLVETSEVLRADALGLETNLRVSTAGLVVVRSSAVKSEDGDGHSGAGVYKSVVVDPKDSEAFRQAIEEVYTSTRSNSALTYQEIMGVTDEQMGLVIQQYSENAGVGRHEEMFYGHANCSGRNRNLVEVNTNRGQLLYDGPAVQASLLLQDSHRTGDGLLHTNPDHNSELRGAVSRTAAVPHAVVLAEKLFGKPMQVEFVNGSIVQVRPLNLPPAEAEVSFPVDLRAVAECAATGVGDMELRRLSEKEHNSHRTGFIVLPDESRFTLGEGHVGHHAFPEEGAVVVLNPSSSGHIQALCRERGLMCFYPRSGSNIDEVWKIIFGRDGRSPQEPRDISLRFVADGYDGRIYELPEDSTLEQHGS